MMRRGLWQQKQKSPSACLLCRYSYRNNSRSFLYARPALGTQPSHNDATISVTPECLSQTTSLAPLRSTRWYSVSAGVTRNGGVGGTANPVQPSLRTAPSALARGRTFERSFSTGGLPSWATKQPQTAANNDGLLPHERAARERAMARNRPAVPEGPTESAAADGAAAGRPAAQANSAPSSRNRAPAWATVGPSWTGPGASPPAAETESGASAQQADPSAFLFPHQRAARQRTGVNSQTQSANPAPQGRVPLPSLSYLLPHERAAKARAAARRQSQPTPASNPSSPRNTLAHNHPSQQTRRQPPRGAAGASRGSRSDPSSQDNAGLTLEPLSSAPKLLPGSFSGFPDRRNRLLTPGLDQSGSGSASVPGPDDQREWRNLTRRQRNPPSALGSSQPLNAATLASGNTWGSADPWKSLTRSPVDETPIKSGSGSEEDLWKRVEQRAAQQEKVERKMAADSSVWDWTKEYEEESKVLRVQRTAREREQNVSASEAPAGPLSVPPRAEQREDRPGRGDRYGRDERPDRREKPKKPKNIRRGDEEEDDDWDEDFYEERRRRKAAKLERERQRKAALEEAGPVPILLPEYISVTNLATALGQKLNVFVRQLEELGFEEATKDSILTGETAALVAQEYGFEPTVDAGEAEDLKPAPPPADPSKLPLRPPVVTIMGHVDHGKTTLLDYLRKSSIVAQEHGGITQHIGAFSVNLSSGKPITFLDTPGHAAFLSMRQRGANVTDMVILVVAADDSVMPQTLEALRHARAAKVPIIVAINKIDKPEANVDRVKSDLASHGVEIEDYGGDVQVVCVSGKTGQGMEDLEENILLLSEMLDIRAERDCPAEGWVLESTIKPIGRVATVLVKRGTLRPGDYVVAGRVHAKVRSLRNEAGVEVDEAPPGTAVEVLGWKEPPEAGDQVLQAPDEARAKSAVRYRQELKERGEVIAQMAQQEQERRERERQREREKALAEAADPRRKGHRRHSNTTTTNANNNNQQVGETDNPAEVGADGAAPTDNVTHVNFVVKADVHGSAEAVTAALLEQGNNEVRARVLVSAPGQITESDVEHAAVSGSLLVNFNNAVPPHVRRLARDAGVPLLDHNVIYHLVEDARERMAAALPPLIVKKVVGEAEVLQVFPINVRGRRYKNIAGCRIGNGVVKKGSKARVLRGGETIFEGVIETLKHVKKDVNEMKKGSECGMSFADWDELQAGDHIQVIEEHTERRTL